MGMGKQKGGKIMITILDQWDLYENEINEKEAILLYEKLKLKLNQLIENNLKNGNDK